MNRLSAIAGATALAIAGAATFADAGPKRKIPTVAIVDALGPKTDVKPGMVDGKITNKDFSKAYAYCPRGYYATGGGVYSGAITEIASAPTTDRRGWFVDGFNPSKTRTFQHRAVVACVKGRSGVRVVKASLSTAEIHRIQGDVIAARGESGR
jgi:hypothetical protein